MGKGFGMMKMVFDGEKDEYDWSWILNLNKEVKQEI